MAFFYDDGMPRNPGWPHYNDPVIIEAPRPQARYRAHQPVYQTAGGHLMAAPGLGMQRSRSVGHRHVPAPAAPVVINNNLTPEELPVRGRRPVSIVQDEPDVVWREHSRPRGRAGSSRDVSPYYVWQQDADNAQLKKELDELKREKDRQAEADRLKNEFLLKQAKEDKRRREEEEKAKELKKKAIEEWKKEEEERKQKEKEQKEKWEREYQDRLKRDLGLSDRQVAKIVQKDSDQAVDLRRTTYTKISRKHVSIETLRVYGLPYKLDDYDPEGYVLIKRWVPEYEQDLLWEHTRKIRDDREVLSRHARLKQLAEEKKALQKVRKRAKSPGIFDIFAAR
ncbi:MAG: hypothetical protein M1825_004140 [Sarcosagium campestre]|nr:MAG: hypothetical protein M1825_004140 [Sarcosagium campestre]